MTMALLTRILTSTPLLVVSQKYLAYFAPILGLEGFTIECQLSRPMSRGEVTLRSSDPNDYPIVNPNYLSHPEDVVTLVKGWCITGVTVTSV